MVGSDRRMDSSTDAEKQVREIVSPSLILTPPTNEPFKIFEGFDFIDLEWFGLPATSQATADAKENVHPLGPSHYCVTGSSVAETLIAEDAKENELSQHSEPANKKPRFSLSLKKT